MSSPGHSRAAGARLRVRLTASAFLLVHLLVPMLRWPCAWGVDQLLYQGRLLWWVVAGAALGILLFPSIVPGSRSREAEPAAGERGRGLPAPLGYGLVALSSGALFLLLRARTPLLGDGLTYLAQLPLSVRSGMRQTEHEPLAFALLAGLYRLVAHTRSPAAGAYALYSVASGALYACAAYGFTRVLARERATRWVAFGLLLTPGFVALFCGYVETYALPAALVFCYTASAVAALRRRISVVLPVLLCGALMTLHATFAALLPSLFVLCWTVAAWSPAGPDPGRCRPLPRLWWGLGGAAAALVLSGAILAAMGRLRSGIGGLPADALYPLRVAGGGEFRAAAGLFSFRHFADLINEAMLVAPVLPLALAGGVWARPGWNRESRFFLLACGVPAVTFALLNPAIGGFRDWDLFAWPAVPAVVWLTVSIVRRIPSEARLVRDAAVLAVACGIHALLWVGVNAGAAASETRFRTILESCPLSRYATAYGWESLGTFRRDAGRTPEAAQAYEQAIRSDPANTRYWDLAALRYAQLGDTNRAIAYLRTAIRLAPRSHAENYGNLGSLYLARSEVDSAIAAYRQALGLNPRLRAAGKGLVDGLMRARRHGEAFDVVSKQIELAPDDPDLLRDGATVALLAGRIDAAERYARRLLAISPADGQAHAVLGECCFARGDDAGAIREWTAALPDFPSKPWLRQRIDAARLRSSHPGT